MTLEELFAILPFSDRIHIVAPTGELIFSNFIDLFPEEYKKSTVKRLQGCIDVCHKDYVNLGLMPPADKDALVRYRFADMEVRSYHEILLEKIVINKGLIKETDPNAYDWMLDKPEFHVRIPEDCPLEVI